MSNNTTRCQHCNGANIRRTGFSPMCVEVEYTCADCKQTTWAVEK